MTNPNPAIPAQAATPGSNEQVQPVPSATTTPPTGNGEQPEGKVTISTKEFAQLQRDAARARSSDRRNQIRTSRTQPAGTGEPAVDEAVQEANTARAEAEGRAFKAELKSGVRDVLDRPEYQSIPKATRELILKNPAALSEAKTVEEAILDIEDFLIEQADFEKKNPTAPRTETTTTQPANTETPRTTPGGGPTLPAGPEELEDPSKLRGSEKTRAIIRNKFRAERNKK